jgi:hypothetical protein
MCSAVHFRSEYQLHLLKMKQPRLIGLLAFVILSFYKLLIPDIFDIVNCLSTNADPVAFHATVIAGTCEWGRWQLGNATISIQSHGIMVLSTIIVTLLFTPVLVRHIIVAMATAVTRLVPGRFKFIRLTRQILLKGIVDDFNEIIQVNILPFNIRIRQRMYVDGDAEKRVIDMVR